MDTEDIESTQDVPAAINETKNNIISDNEAAISARDVQDNTPKVYVVLGSFVKRRMLIEQSLNLNHST